MDQNTDNYEFSKELDEILANPTKDEILSKYQKNPLWKLSGEVAQTTTTTRNYQLKVEVPYVKKDGSLYKKIYWVFSSLKLEEHKSYDLIGYFYSAAPNYRPTFVATHAREVR